MKKFVIPVEAISNLKHALSNLIWFEKLLKECQREEYDDLIKKTQSLMTVLEEIIDKAELVDNGKG